MKRSNVTYGAIGYAMSHFVIKFGINTYPSSTFTTSYGLHIFKTLRAAKYLALFGTIGGYYSVARWTI